LEANHVELVDSEVINNHSTSSSGGVEVGTGVIRRCVFIGNTTDLQVGVEHKGGALSIRDGEVTNCLFVGNEAYKGGAIFTHGVRDRHSHLIVSNVTVTNCTFVGNEATSGSGGAIFRELQPLSVYNCIIWDCGPEPLAGGVHYFLGIRHNILQGGLPNAAGWPEDPDVYSDLLDVAPGFVDAGNGDYRLAADSPAIDIGWAEVAPDVDLEGDPRPQGEGHDLGAYEYPSDIPFGDVDRNLKVDALDVQVVINAVLGLSKTQHADLNDDDRYDALDVQLVINAVLGVP
jgi:hypothetical protein